MKIFVSFVEDDRKLADTIIAALAAEGHKVFARPDRLPPGPSQTVRVRAAMKQADYLVSLVSPAAISQGSLSQSDLSLAREKWRDPKRSVLPVLARPLDGQPMPGYLTGCTTLVPEGDAASEVAHAVARSRRRRLAIFRRPWAAALAGAAALALVAGTTAWFMRTEDRAEPELAQLDFSVLGSTQLLNWGQRARYQLLETHGVDPKKYLCKVGPTTSPNIASITHDAHCANIEIQAKDGPFVNHDGTPYDQGYYNPNIDSVPFVITSPSGKELLRDEIPVYMGNSSAAMILEGIEGADVTRDSYPIQSGRSYELAVGFANTPMPKETTCSLGDGSDRFLFTRLEGCRFRLDNVAPGLLAVEVRRPDGYKVVASFRLNEARLGANGAQGSAPTPGDDRAAGCVRSAGAAGQAPAKAAVDPAELARRYPVDLDIFWFKGANIAIKRVGDLAFGGFAVSRDGVTYEAAHRLDRWMPNEKFLICILSVPGRGTLGPLDLTDHIKNAIGKTIAQSREQGSGPITCTAGHCEISRPQLCNAGWSKLTLGRAPASDEVSYDLGACPPAPPSTLNLCLAVPGDVPPMRPNQVIKGALHAEAGGAIPFEISIPEGMRKNVPGPYDHLAGRFVVLAAKDPAMARDQPYILAARAADITGHDGIVLAIAAGGCGPGGLEESFSGWLYDVDGKGLVRGDLRQTIIPTPSRPFFELVLEGKDGRRFGPYAYAFDPVSLFEKEASTVPAPTLSCDRRSCSIPGTASWIKVAEVAYGPTPDRLAQSKALSWSRDDISAIVTGKVQEPEDPKLSPLERWQRKNEAKRVGGPTIAVITVPADWPDLYYRLTYRDGSLSPIARIPMPH